jgi:endo-1,4-beta-xylanase
MVALLFVVVPSVLAAASAGDEPALKDRMPEGVLIGGAVNPGHFTGSDAVGAAIVGRHFDTITAENVLKWAVVHPEPDRYAFEAADRFVAYGKANGMAVIGHTLVWHNQVPDWVFQGEGGAPADRETGLRRLRDHIQAVMGRYKGRIRGWDVVNEAVDEDGSLRDSKWRRMIGDDYVAQAFRLAAQADPAAELYYNDYNLWKPAKRAGALRLVKEVRDQGLRVDGIGEQGHYLLREPSLEQVDAALRDLAATGLKVMITELDVDVLPRDPALMGADLAAGGKAKERGDIYRDGLPPAAQEELARRYADLFRVFLKHRGPLARVTFWGVTDGGSWLNNFPVRGRVNHPLLWDRDGKAKPALAAVASALQK